MVISCGYPAVAPRQALGGVDGPPAEASPPAARVRLRLGGLSDRADHVVPCGGVVGSGVEVAEAGGE
jgi:hypothetical protein